jgi:hypothetical protein
MYDSFNPPPIPGTSALPGGSYAATTNPYFTVANQFLPRNLHDVIRWSRYITTQSPVVTEVIRKLSTYPITDFVVDTTSQQIKEKYEEVFESFRLKPALHDVGFEYYTVGNVFVSIYFPVHRNLECTHCNTSYFAKNCNWVTFKNYEFQGECPACKYKGALKVSDKKDLSIENMNLIKWDPTNIAVNHNPITGESEYYYKIPNDIKKRVQIGDRLFVDSIPWSMVKAIQNNQDFKFDKGNIFHLKNISAGHQINGIAVPPLISLFGLVFYQATLRKANESISTDFMNPMRVVYPTPQTGNSDPVVSISMRNFVSNMTEAFIKHKRDRNHVLVAPVPIGYQAISGEGRNLLVSQEIAQAEESILLSLGVSKELLSGVTNWSSSTVGLRLLQNTMNTYTSQIEGLLNWVMTRVSKYLGIETCKVTLTPFKLTDDDALRQMLLQLHTTQECSPETLFEAFGMKYDDELKSQEKAAILKATSDVRTKFAVDQAVFVAGKEVVDRFDNNSDYRTVLAKGQAIAQELFSMTDEKQQMAVMGQLRVEDYSMYLMVSQLLSEYAEQSQMNAQTASMQQEAAGGEPGGSGPSGGKPKKDGAGAKQDPATPKKPNSEKE